MLGGGSLHTNPEGPWPQAVVPVCTAFPGSWRLPHSLHPSARPLRGLSSPGRHQRGPRCSPSALALGRGTRHEPAWVGAAAPERLLLGQGALLGSWRTLHEGSLCRAGHSRPQALLGMARSPAACPLHPCFLPGGESETLQADPTPQFSVSHVQVGPLAGFQLAHCCDQLAWLPGGGWGGSCWSGLSSHMHSVIDL